ncbi:MAG: hypothetical protein KAG26_01655, partial [Methylococcales bacterium]|nr:hypothetical protein [Methylococcales bacterium]
MTHFSNKYFNPLWRDDCFDLQALEIPLLFPDSPNKSNINDEIWINKQRVNEEFIFECHHKYDSPRQRVAILKPSNMAQHYKVTNAHDEVITPNQSMLNAFFPPKAWMTDNGQERCMMLAAAKLAKGDVLVAGLGLAIYPQFIFALKRPVKSITIIESNPK